MAPAPILPTLLLSLEPDLYGFGRISTAIAHRHGQALYALDKGDVWEAYQLYLQAGLYSAAHDIAVLQLAPEAVVRDDLELLESIFVEFTGRPVEGWHVRGKVSILRLPTLWCLFPHFTDRLFLFVSCAPNRINPFFALSHLSALSNHLSETPCLSPTYNAARDCDRDATLPCLCPLLIQSVLTNQTHHIIFHAHSYLLPCLVRPSVDPFRHSSTT